jgi:hypothetical protein
MGNWFRRFIAMPDRQRAKLLAQLLLIFTVTLLYGLGGVSLYLRARYLSPTPTPEPLATTDAAMAPTIEPTFVVVETPTPVPTPSPPTTSPTETAVAPSPTLYPTITPHSSAVEPDTRISQGFDAAHW